MLMSKIQKKGRETVSAYNMRMGGFVHMISQFSLKDSTRRKIASGSEDVVEVDHDLTVSLEIKQRQLANLVVVQPVIPQGAYIIPL